MVDLLIYFMLTSRMAAGPWGVRDKPKAATEPEGAEQTQAQ
jgi:hypothetical protein